MVVWEFHNYQLVAEPLPVTQRTEATSQPGMSHRVVEQHTLPEWIGNELIGLAKEPFKRDVCQKEEWQRNPHGDLPDCHGCALHSSCLFGQLFEPQQAMRPFALCPAFPVTPEFRLGGSPLPVDAVLVGDRRDAWEALLKSLNQAGTADASEPVNRSVRNRRRATASQRGLGPKNARIPVQLRPGPNFETRMSRLTVASLPIPQVQHIGVVPSLRVELLSPLRLTRHAGDVHELITEPECFDLVSACIRVIRGLAERCGETEPLKKYDEERLLDAARQVPVVSQEVLIFQQKVQGNRGSNRYSFEGLRGSLTFADVPVELLPWLVWGGRLCVGDRRAYGAGRWQLRLD